MLIAGIDSSTQACKVTVRDLATGMRVREGKASHPPQTLVHPDAWWTALLTAVRRAGGLDDVLAISVSGQQHTPVFLDSTGAVVCESPLWNDTGSHAQMVTLNAEVGRDEWIRRTGLPITLSDTVVKLRWLRDTDPDAVRRTAAVAIVHDWLTWRLRGFGAGTGGLDALVTDRSEASGTAYWSGATNEYDRGLFEHAFGKTALLPEVLHPLATAGVTGPGIPGIPAGLPIGVGSGDNAAAALALGLDNGDAVLSLGTSGVVYTRSAVPVHDYAGYVCNYADATGEHLPLVATLNAARNFELAGGLLGCTYAELSDLALEAEPGAGGLTLLPYFEGERTPDLPHARGSLHQASLTNLTRPNFARAVIEGTLASQVEMLDALRDCGIRPQRLLLIGGAAQSPAVQQILTQMVDVPVVVPDLDEYVTKGAAMQAVAALSGSFPTWAAVSAELAPSALHPQIVEQHNAAKAALGYDDTAPAASLTGGVAR
ncbi:MULTISPECIES: FGGY family carbohydrate kinase [unclassified Rathayibacter]|uniref:FGGY family carbohydrate kinase n=1 Tax=unclassified Rathayibacter TaxID=2609250 RepID=UPI00104E13DE|nr:MULTISPECIES: FGGY family carbohydrate kinase [unclassified Rathayibacter]TCL83129.1 gluconate kinase (FGGY family) [Rathayibacter sp. PhB192]TCM28627.1 gluconate kinase (FGGY family) [Rathayibacter sp. PhB179]